jgi:hypothetical protein
MLFVAVLLIGAFEAGRDYQAQQPMGSWQKRFIAIEFLCAPERKWSGKRTFCGKPVSPPS